MNGIMENKTHDLFLEAGNISKNITFYILVYAVLKCYSSSTLLKMLELDFVKQNILNIIK